MLLEHFKLGVQPFGVTPDARFLYLSQTHREALASLFYGIQAGRGFTALIAAPGMGKTTLIFHLLGLLAENAKTAFLFQTLCGPEEFLRSLLADLGIDGQGGDSVRMHASLNAYLLHESKKGRQVVVVIDEAQNLDVRVLELVRMLSNFETPGKKLMHLVLSGQPQLAERLSSEQLTQLRQRISIVARLAPFNANETREYIEHRLRVAAGPTHKAIFSNEAYAMIAQQSGGIPRNINNLCFNAMSLACALNKDQVEASMVWETINDLDLTTIPKPKAPRSPGTWPSDSLSLLNPVPSVSGAWRYRWGVAIAFLICLVLLLVYLAVPSNNRVLTQPAAVAVPQRASSDSDAVRAVDAPSSALTQQRTGEKETMSRPIAPVSSSRRKEDSRSSRRSNRSTPSNMSILGSCAGDVIVLSAAETLSDQQLLQKTQGTSTKGLSLLDPRHKGKNHE
jgi:general secretion pathway protein A